MGHLSSDNRENKGEGKAVASKEGHIVQSMTTNAPSLQRSSFGAESVELPDVVLAHLKLPKKFIPSTDLELTGLVTQILLYMTEEDLIAYIDNVKRFDTGPVHVMASLPGESLIDSNSGRAVFWWHLRKDLEILPRYFDTVEKLRLSYKEGTSLLSSLVDSYTSDHHGVTSLIETLTKIMANCDEKGLDFKVHIDQLKTFLETARREGGVGRALGIAQLGVAAGMNIEQSFEIVTDIYNGNGIAGYVFMALYDELNALAANDGNGELIFRSLKAVIARDERFSAFTELLYLAATQTTYSQREILEKIIAPKVIPAADNAFLPATNDGSGTSEQSVIEQAAEVLFPVPASDTLQMAPVIKKPNEYFPDINVQKLIHGILPYRAGRNLQEGLHDLHALMKKEHQEGAWVFDPKSDTWYSLGGRTNFKSGSVRQEFFPYDVSALSSTPIFVHIHPERSETFIRPSRDSLVYPQLQDKLTAFLASMPSGADFQTIAALMGLASQAVPLKGLIVTSIGLTELYVPKNPQRVFEFAKTFRDLKDEVLVQFNAEGYLDIHGIHEPHIKFVKELLGDLNRRLPPDFQVVVHDYNEEIDIQTQ